MLHKQKFTVIITKILSIEASWRILCSLCFSSQGCPQRPTPEDLDVRYRPKFQGLDISTIFSWLLTYWSDQHYEHVHSSSKTFLQAKGRRWQPFCKGSRRKSNTNADVKVILLQKSSQGEGGSICHKYQWPSQKKSDESILLLAKPGNGKGKILSITFFGKPCSTSAQDRTSCIP